MIEELSFEWLTHEYRTHRPEKGDITSPVRTAWLTKANVHWHAAQYHIDMLMIGTHQMSFNSDFALFKMMEELSFEWLTHLYHTDNPERATSQYHIDLNYDPQAQKNKW